MELNEYFLMQLERESQASRKALERVPAGRANWKPHEKSMELGYLTALVATMPGWVAIAVELDELNLDDPSSDKFKTKALSTQDELIRALEDSSARARQALVGTTEDYLKRPWRLIMGGKTVSENPRYVVITDSFNHLAHHRGQLTVYLRLLGASVPAIYGPSADEYN